MACALFISTVYNYLIYRGIKMKNKIMITYLREVRVIIYPDVNIILSYSPVLSFVCVWITLIVAPCCRTWLQVSVKAFHLSTFQNKATKSRTQSSKSKSTPPGCKVSPQNPSTSKSSPSPGKSPPSSTPGASRQGPSSEVRKTLEFGAGKSTPSVAQDEGNSLLWVDKYRPRSLKNLIGQQGEQSCANKLLKWLKNWHKIHSGNSKPAGMCACVHMSSQVGMSWYAVCGFVCLWN